MLLKKFRDGSLFVFDLNTELIEFEISYPLCSIIDGRTPHIINYVDLDRVEYSGDWTEDSFCFSPTGKTDVFRYNSVIDPPIIELMDGYYTWDVKSQNVYDSTGNVVLSNIVDYDFCTDFEWYYLLDSTGTLYRFSRKSPSYQVVGENIVAIYKNHPKGVPTFIVDENSVYDTCFSVDSTLKPGNAIFIN